MDNQWIKNVLLIASGAVVTNVIKAVRDRKMGKEIGNEIDDVIEMEEIIIDED